MTTITLTKDSHKHPENYRIKLQDSTGVLGEDPKALKKIDNKLPTIKTSSNVAVIGAGFGGMATAIKTMKELKENDVRIFERHDNFGGTWYANTYPGCASDIPAVWYSFSFALTSNWTRVQPPQYEMEEYILRVAKEYKLKEKIRFNTSVDECLFDEDTGYWTLYAHDKNTGQKLEHKAKILVSCTGVLVHPMHLKEPGLENFKGKYIHSALWDHSVDFKGKNVVVFGNGCSANQVVPALLKDYQPASLTQIVRSKHYVMPPVPKILVMIYGLLRYTFFGLQLVRWFTVAVAESRFPLFRGEGPISRLVRWANRRMSVNYMKKAPKKYWDMLIPDYKVGCKRLIFDYGYIPALHDPRLKLTNERVDKVVADGIYLKDGSFIKADIIVACTGYDVPKSFTLPVKTSKGASLKTIWDEEGVGAYRTSLVKNIPNYFIVGGPNIGTGHASVVMSIEHGVDYYMKIAKPILQGKEKSVVVKPEAYDSWFKLIQSKLRESVFGTAFGGCTSWYADQKINFTVYPFSQIHFWYITHFPNYRDLVYNHYDKKNV
ncbi:hypothetical protein KGF57_002694 [Candida theae]|uniref:FAD/NAD(P)-binding domain-containing protein n=1 Tax=Candida theae TaxID=1198502 RepID=A0AAD5BF91_9ASCO|nr:uncharacterized protein KGF57_002694 [Candida theae]KAI5958338.1 hypothetical protein KGF57_002694 [Candida theae]